MVKGIALGLVTKTNKTYAKGHQACDYCVKKRFICAQLHTNVAGYIAFIGILPRPGVGVDVDDIKHWLG